MDSVRQCWQLPHFTMSIFLCCRTTTRVLLNIFRRKFRIWKVLKFCTAEKGVENAWHQLQLGLLKVDDEKLFFPPKSPCLQLHLECCKHNCTSCPGICAYHSCWQCRENQFYKALRTETLMEGSIWLSGLHGHFNLIERGTAWAKIEKCKDHKPIPRGCNFWGQNWSIILMSCDSGPSILWCTQGRILV